MKVDDIDAQEQSDRRLELIALNMRGRSGPLQAARRLYERARKSGGHRYRGASFPASDTLPEWPGCERAGTLVDALSPDEWRQAREQVARAEAMGISIVTWIDDDYPRALRRTLYPPPVLYVKGRLSPSDRAAVAVVGSRKAEARYVEFAHRLSAALGELGFTVVSGLARGVDRGAHEGALSIGGRTLAVLGHGLQTLYPSDHRRLAQDIARSGALLSFFPLGAPALPRHFPARNWVIAGLSLGVVVVRGDVTSGAMVTATSAASLGKMVMAVPGDIDADRSSGPHRLLQEGAALVLDASDVAAHLADALAAEKIELQPLRRDAPPDGPGNAQGAANALENAVVQRLRRSPCDVSTVAQALTLTISDALALMSRMEVAGEIEAIGGGLYRLRRRP